MRNAERIIAWAASSDSTRRGHWSAIAWFPYRWGGVLTTSIHPTQTHTHLHAPTAAPGANLQIQFSSSVSFSQKRRTLVTISGQSAHSNPTLITHTCSQVREQPHKHTQLMSRSRPLEFVLVAWAASWWGVWLKPLWNGQYIRHRTGSDHQCPRRGFCWDYYSPVSKRRTELSVSSVFAFTFPAEPPTQSCRNFHWTDSELTSEL